MATAATEWRPFCGTEYGRTLHGLDLATVTRWAEIPGPLVAGDPVVCDLPAGHTPQNRHCCTELGFEWWGG